MPATWTGTEGEFVRIPPLVEVKPLPNPTTADTELVERIGGETHRVKVRSLSLSGRNGYTLCGCWFDDNPHSPYWRRFRGTQSDVTCRRPGCRRRGV